MTDAEKYAKLLAICKDVVAKWDEAYEAHFCENKFEDFVDAGDVKPIREWIKSQESDNAQS